MARKARVEFAGAVYHVLDRGDRREAIFRDDRDREAFLSTLGEVCRRTGWRVHAYVLMSNHYPLLIETPQPNLVAGMRWFQTTVTARFNRRHRLCEHLFQGRYKSVIVDPRERGYFVTLSDYIHLNPVRAGMVGPADRLFDYAWSSYPHFVQRRRRPAWLAVETVLGELSLRDDGAGRLAYARGMRNRALAAALPEAALAIKELRQQWCLGGASFREGMLRLLDGMTERLRLRKETDAPVLRCHDEAEAERLIVAGLERLALGEEELARLRKSDPRKMALAGLVRRKTAVSNRWLAQRLHLGHVSQASRVADLDLPAELEPLASS